MSCEYNYKNECILTNKICTKKYEKSIKKCKYANKVKEDAPYKDVYEVKEDVTCKECGCHTAYKYIGRLYPNGLPKEEIMKLPYIKGKYYDQPYLSSAVGFGGVVPYKCGNCGAVGLIDICLEGYDAVFTKS